MVIEERYHVHVDAVKETGLVNRNIDRMIAGPDQEIRLLGGLDPDGQEDGAAAGSADTEIAVPLADIGNHVRMHCDLTHAAPFMEMSKHDAVVIGSEQ
jgi:hypothetical protein